MMISPIGGTWVNNMDTTKKRREEEKDFWYYWKLHDNDVDDWY